MPPPQGYGFVHFETEEAAKKAIAGVDGMMFGSQHVVVQVRYESLFNELC